MSRATHAIVIGCGVAGALTAIVLSKHFTKITIIDRDDLSTNNVERKGIPQARHTHLLLNGGIQAVAEIAPEILTQLIAQGARRIKVPENLLLYNSNGWMGRFSSNIEMLACSRFLLDSVLRNTVASIPEITVLSRTKIEALLGDRNRVTGVRINSNGLIEQEVFADLVIDASGVSSRAPQWLRAFGFSDVPEEIVDPGLTYLTRIYRPPDGVIDFPIVNIQAVPVDGNPSLGSTLVPVENNRWMVTIGSTRGIPLFPNEESFTEAANKLRHPIIAELIASATPVTPVVSHHGTRNRRRRFDKLASWPQGFLVLGDALSAVNPVYGHGMTVAAQSAQRIDQMLHKTAYKPEMTSALQRSIARITDLAWTVATGQDVQYRATSGPRPGRISKLLQGYVGRLMHRAATDPVASQAVFSVLGLSAPLISLVKPKVMATVLFGRKVTQSPFAEAAIRNLITRRQPLVG